MLTAAWDWGAWWQEYPPDMFVQWYPVPPALLLCLACIAVLTYLALEKGPRT